MPKKSDKKPTPEYDSKREQGVLLDKIYSEVKTIGEGHSVLNNKIDAIGSELQQVKLVLNAVQTATLENSHDIKVLKGDVKELKGDVKELKGDVKELKGDVKELKSDATVLKDDVKELKQDQARLEQKLDTVIDDHEHRIQKLEAVR